LVSRVWCQRCNRVRLYLMRRSRSEALRHGLEHLANADPDEWDTIAAEYAVTFYSLPAVELVNQLSIDLTVLEHTLAAKPAAHLHRVAAQLSVVMAMALASAQQLALARRWWRTARRYADQSRDLDTRIWVRDWEVVNGTYERRPIRHILHLADQTISLAGDHVCCGAAGVWSGRAQALALAGHTDESLNALRRTAQLTEQMPATVVADAESMFGWPEVRLRHTESYVYTHLGLTSQAIAAQDRALELYPAELARERAQLQMHRARCHILNGDIADGLRYAASVLDDLPADQHNALLYEVGQHVMRAVPTVEHRRAEYGELHERLLTLPADREKR
jgi:tetratricopeptide (TPR) repeat protein